MAFNYEVMLLSCLDADECLINIDNCDSNAVCNNTMGGFDCTCSSGYFGDGTTCIAEGLWCNQSIFGLNVGM